jgi:hypothetical protein
MSTFPVRYVFIRQSTERSFPERSMASSRRAVAVSHSTSESPDDGSIAAGGSSTSLITDPSVASASTNRSPVVLQSVWDFENIKKRGGTDVFARCWHCAWCGLTLKGWNATKALNHVSKATGNNDVKACTGPIPKETLRIFQAFRFQKLGAASVKKQQKAAFNDSISENQHSLAVMFEAKRSRSSKSSGAGDGVVDMTEGDDVVDGPSVGAKNATRLTSAIAEFVYSKGLSFSATEGEHFMQILKLSRLVSTSYRPPTRKALSNELLDVSYEMRLEKYMNDLDIDAEVYGLSMFGDGATVHGMPLMNILASGVGEPSAVLAIVDCKLRLFCFCFLFSVTTNLIFCCHSFPFAGTEHLVAGGKKNATYVAGLFDPWVKKLDPLSTRIDCVFFDGASNVQKAGRLLAAKYPRMHVQACAAHSVSLFFSDITKLWQIKLMLVNYRRLYRMFGSGAMHSPYALFIKQSKVFNAGRKVGLIRAAETRMAGHAYAQCRMLRLRDPLKATISSAAYKDLKLKGFPTKVEEYLNDDDMWQATYEVQRCLFPMIRVLRLCDKSECGGMSKILYYVHKTDEAIQKSMDSLKDLKYFAEHLPEDADDDDGLDEVDSDDDDNGAVVHDDEDEQETGDYAEELHLGEKIKAIWMKRREKLITPLSIAAWFCSPNPDIMKDVVDNSTGPDRFEVEDVIKKLYYPIQDEEVGELILTFWAEFDDFQTRNSRTSYGRAHIWKAPEIKKGNCHRWHKLYSIPFTKVFGKVACRVCSKPLGCGLAERNWGNLKQLKSGQRSHLSGDRAQKQSTVYGAACLEKSRRTQAAEESTGEVLESRWTDADEAFAHGLESWDNGPGGVPRALVPRRIFNAWIEDWEWECIHKSDPVAEARLIQKYGGLSWLDPDGDDGDVLCIGHEYNMDFQAGRGGSGWCIIGTREDTGAMEPWAIEGGDVIDLIADYEQRAELNVTVVVNAELRAANDVRLQEEEAARVGRRSRKRRR